MFVHLCGIQSSVVQAQEYSPGVVDSASQWFTQARVGALKYTHLIMLMLLKYIKLADQWMREVLVYVSTTYQYVV